MSSPDDVVRRVVQGVLGVELPDEQTDLIATGLLDSLALVSLVVELEQELGVEIPFATLDLDDFRTLRTLCALVAPMVEVA